MVWSSQLEKFLDTHEASEYHRLQKQVDDIRKKEGISANFEKLELALAEYAEKNEVRIWRQV